MSSIELGAVAVDAPPNDDDEPTFTDFTLDVRS